MFIKNEIKTKEVKINSEIIETREEDNYLNEYGRPTYFCVGIIDIVNSTKTVARLPPNKTSKYYEIFLNHMAKIVKEYHGHILKTMGDSLLFYFPDSCYSERKFGFLCALECGFSVVKSRKELTESLQKQMLPEIDFRVSFDYGNVAMLKDKEDKIDLVGPTINTCSKINGLCPVNGIVVGGDLYEKTRIFKEYQFKNIQSYCVDMKHPYPVFKIFRK